MEYIIIYFILMSKGWQFVAVDTNPVSVHYCEALKSELENKFTNTMGNMKVVCAIANGGDV